MILIRDRYAFALPEDTPLLEEIDLLLLRELEGARARELFQRHLGERP